MVLQNKTLNSFKLFAFKRKSVIFWPFEGFFELHSRVTKGKKGKERTKKGDFLANGKSLNEFIQKAPQL